MMIYQAIILGIVEGISEFLPISSTGHLILTSRLLGIESGAFLSSFEIGIQLGAILSVVALYLTRVIKNWKIIKNLAFAFLPAVVLGLIFYSFIKNYLFESYGTVLWSLLVGGIALIIFELLHKEKPGAVGEIENMTIKQSLIIGLFQCLALVPGVSRAAATIVGGLAIGIRRKAIVEFSFLLAIPTMAAATVLDLSETGLNFSGREWGVLAVGFVTAFIVACVAVKFLTKYVEKHTFIPFGIYRILAALAFAFFLLY